MNNLEEFLEISEEVKEALYEKRAIVALESTIISHGMPYPENVESALNSEKNIRENNAVPATIAIIKGKIKVGLNKEELEYMGANKNIAKSSRRDLPVMLALKKDGATTVTTTMIGASLAGIKVFATGGIGGVHRYAQETFDISADLQELSKTNVAVVCAGAKSILDIGLTIEYLETFGIPVLGYKTENFPAFYTRESGYKVDYKIDTTKDIADVLDTKWRLGLNGGVLVCNPIPEEYEMDKNYINKIIDDTVKEARDKNISGKDVTPFILAKLHSVTENKSLKANKELVYNNCRVAANIAYDYSNFIR
ncbi:indigoidine synthase A family protein [Brachyspira hampsonii 30446]|uniref:Pseudouridine-5'-phosphate glycosidase n=3 Tax=Brachyspira hampsonii TaxID=1287055 RepID=A0A2U4ETR3_9SPIR|nr:pseudouridine-5'-phosphate glycosidase [Brachyspira hampsonii]EKV55855.1 indigoidine synthase A family protein [Brachyspira hampsonii 30446]OEJ17413.1 pseudouridine-5-phosphate glycosidase [Brachyspira hampsonii]